MKTETLEINKLDVCFIKLSLEFQIGILNQNSEILVKY